jgi:DNA-binding winged helix-turn-helix (wHTH) protein
MPLSSATSSIYSFGVFELDGRAGELRRDGVKLKLQDQLFQVLLRLLGRPGEIVSRDELRSALWSDDTFVDFDTGLNTTIKRLRETLGGLGGQSHFHRDCTEAWLSIYCSGERVRFRTPIFTATN